MKVSVHHVMQYPQRTEGEVGSDPLGLGYKWLWADMWVLGIKSGTLEK